MTLNRELFVEDPTKKDIPNLGVAKVGQPDDERSWGVLEYELGSFVCEGEYERGLERILTTYLAHLDQDSQPEAIPLNRGDLKLSDLDPSVCSR